MSASPRIAQRPVSRSLVRRVVAVCAALLPGTAVAQAGRSPSVPTIPIVADVPESIAPFAQDTVLWADTVAGTTIAVRAQHRVGVLGCPYQIVFGGTPVAATGDQPLMFCPDLFRLERGEPTVLFVGAYTGGGAGADAVSSHYLKALVIEDPDSAVRPTTFTLDQQQFWVDSIDFTRPAPHQFVAELEEATYRYADGALVMEAPAAATATLAPSNDSGATRIDGAAAAAPTQPVQATPAASATAALPPAPRHSSGSPWVWTVVALVTVLGVGVVAAQAHRAGVSRPAGVRIAGRAGPHPARAGARGERDWSRAGAGRAGPTPRPTQDAAVAAPPGATSAPAVTPARAPTMAPTMAPGLPSAMPSAMPSAVANAAPLGSPTPAPEAPLERAAAAAHATARRVLAGAAGVAALGTLLPWLAVSGPGGSAVKLGVEYATGILALLAIGAGLVGQYYPPLRRAQRWCFLAGATLPLVAFIDFATSRLVVEAAGLDMHYGVGLFLTAGASALGTWIADTERRPGALPARGALPPRPVPYVDRPLLAVVGAISIGLAVWWGVGAARQRTALHDGAAETLQGARRAHDTDPAPAGREPTLEERIQAHNDRKMGLTPEYRQETKDLARDLGCTILDDKGTTYCPPR